ncbi:MAG TPA: amidohydrolase family protein [Acidimicrobiales bacterium]|nr:amidohydrolase family protein [Acidimicrobiales bacterium]
MIVDTHCHLYPERWRPEGRMPSDIFEVDKLLDELGAAGVDRAIVSDPHIWYGDADMNELARCKEYNDFAAGIAAGHSGRLSALGTVVPWRGAGHLDEARRAIEELGLRGLGVATSDGGQMLDAIPDEFWELVTGLGVPVFLHPGATVVGQEHMGDHRLGELCGRPLDMTLTLARAVMSGLLERHLGLKLLCAHAGGAICMIAHRLDFGHELRDYAPLGPWNGHRLSDPPSASVQRLFLDTVTYGPEPLRLAIRTVGARHVCFGTDHPPVPFPIERSLEVVRALRLDDADEDRVLGENAAELFGLGEPG